MSDLKAYQVGDSDVYVAEDEAGAMKQAEEMVGEGEYSITDVRALTDEELDKEYPEFDENEKETGGVATIRQWLSEAVTPGWLCGSDWQ